MLDVRLRGATLYKLVFILSGVAIILYLYSRSSGSTSGTKGPQLPEVDERVTVDVYYECLCPDSRSFIVNQLYPAWQNLKDIMEINLIPWGKADSEVTEDGYTFTCQHGQLECEGNTYHTCAVKSANTDISIPYVKCMIEDNREPAAIARSCAEQINIPYSPIEECARGKEGNQLLFLMGEMTHNLSPSVTFIPTVEIEKSQDRFRNALKNLGLQVCQEFREKFNKTPESCAQYFRD